MLPNYFHVGQPKAGSTTLHFMLVDHPDVCLVKSKEAHFFDIDEAYDKGLDFYRKAHFAHCVGQKVVGDITPAYFNAVALERIAKDFGDTAKITVCFRFPVARTYSHYYHSVRLLEERQSLFTRLQPNTGYLRASCGGNIFEKILELFPRENVMPMIFERDLVSSGSIQAYDKVCNFLGIEPAKVPENEKKGVGFRPNVAIANHNGSVEDYRGAHEFKKGDVIIETLQWTTHYHAEVISNPDSETRERYTTIFDEVTTELTNDQVREIYASNFAEDVEKLKELLGDDIPEWSLDDRTIKAPPQLESRIGRKPSILHKLRERFG